MIVYRSALVGV